MPNQPNISLQNNFIAGLKTEYTGLNFPENAATDAQNVIFSMIGEVFRREGFDYEANFVQTNINRTTNAITTFLWENVGGDGQTKILVVQIGQNIYFFQSTNSTIASPLSTTLLTASTFPLSTFVAAGGSYSNSLEAQFAHGNGYLFIFHPNCDPVYCIFTPGSPNTVTPNLITMQIRDFLGVNPEPGNPKFSARPNTLNNEHNYNLQNQGWTAGVQWAANSSTQNFSVGGSTLSFNTGSYTFNVGLVNGVSAGQQVTLVVNGALSYINGGVGYTSGYTSSNYTIAGSVTSYSNPNMTINVTTAPGVFQTIPGTIGAILSVSWYIQESNVVNTINTFYSGVGVYPSNTDIWFEFKNTSNVFSPATTVANVSLSNAPAPKGHFILNAFNQQRSATAGIPSLTDVKTTVRPRTGCWFQGRVWYGGVDAAQNAAGDQVYYTWTENLYFSQIITTPTEFGFCYQENDPTDETLFDLLPTDGGVITIQGSGAIYKLFPVQNGLVVFAANGIWFITGSQGIGFSANDFTVTKLSGVRSISGTSFVNVQGWPVFWNEEGIYEVTPNPQGQGLTVNNICVGTILSFYQNIPLQSKKYARGDYNPINFELQWCYRSTNESTVTDRYQFDTVLILNTFTKAFYYYTLSSVGGTTPFIHDIRYISGPGGSTSPSPVFKYLCSALISGNYQFTFAEERDSTNWVDWHSSTGSQSYTSYFITGYQLHAKAISKWQPVYLNLFLRNSVTNSYSVQGRWEFAISGNSGRWSTSQVTNDNSNTANFGMIRRRYKIRGHGYALQYKVTSISGKNFDIMGWSVYEGLNTAP